MGIGSVRWMSCWLVEVNDADTRRGYRFLVSDDRNGWLRADDGCWASASWDPNSTVIGPLLGVAQMFGIKVWLEIWRKQYVAEHANYFNV